MNRSKTSKLANELDRLKFAARRGVTHLTGVSNAQFHDNEVLHDALVTVISVVGEIAAKIIRDHPDFVNACPQIPWHQMKGMRNRLVHDYFGIDPDSVWKTATESLPALLEQIERIRHSEKLANYCRPQD